MSEDDKQTFTRIYDVDTSKIHVAPNGVDVESYNEVYQSRSFKKEHIISVPLILFLGSGHPPNVESAKQIIRNIAPKLPNVYFLIAGSVCWMIRNESHGKNVGLAYLITDEEKKGIIQGYKCCHKPHDEWFWNKSENAGLYGCRSSRCLDYGWCTRH